MRAFLVVATSVIGWLNKQINEQMLGGRGSAFPGTLPLSAIRRSSPLTSATAPQPFRMVRYDFLSPSFCLKSVGRN